MTERPDPVPGEPDPDLVQQRAQELNPEELAVGSDDPRAQAQAILADSEARIEHPEETKHASNQTPD
ncbi:MAG: hypothetical protein ACJ74U_03785 [Jatrophihabitantaceae bacterium]